MMSPFYKAWLVGGDYHVESNEMHIFLTNPLLFAASLREPVVFQVAIQKLKDQDIQGVTGGTDQTSGECSLC
jgi:hypothetical protein